MSRRGEFRLGSDGYIISPLVLERLTRLDQQASFSSEVDDDGFSDQVSSEMELFLSIHSVYTIFIHAYASTSPVSVAQRQSVGLAIERSRVRNSLVSSRFPLDKEFSRHC